MSGAQIDPLQASDFDVVNNTVSNYLDPRTGLAPEDFTDDEIVLQIVGDTLETTHAPLLNAR